MKTNFKLSIEFSLRNENKIQHEEEWSGVKSWEPEKEWFELRVSPIEMAQEESPASLANLLIDNLGQGPSYEHKPVLNEESGIIQKIKAIPAMSDISEISVRGTLSNENGACWDRLFKYSSQTKIMIGTATGNGDDFALGIRYGDLTFTEARVLCLPRNLQQDGTYKGFFYNETDEEKHQRLYKAFNEKMETLQKQYGNAKEAFLANLSRFPSFPDMERAKEIIDYDAQIEFPDKFILVYGCPESSALSREIEKRGASFRDRAIKKANYFVIWDPFDQDGYHHSTIEDMLTFRDRGGEAVFVTAFQLWKALSEEDTMSEEEIEMLNLEREEKRILTEMDKLQDMITKQKEIIEEKLKKETEKQKKKAEKEEAQRKERERKEKEKAEKAQTRQLAMQAEEERKEEIRKQKEAKQRAKQEEQRIADEARKKKELAVEKARAQANILYAPGQEPDRIKKRIETLLEKLDGAYPDHIIFRLAKDHTHWDETVTELYKQLGYADRTSFLEAYGFRMSSEKGGRPSTLDADSIIEELLKRYPHGFGAKTISQIKQENPDLKIKTLENKASELFGESLVKHMMKRFAEQEKKDKESTKKANATIVKKAVDDSSDLGLDDLEDFSVDDLADLDLDDDDFEL